MDGQASSDQIGAIVFNLVLSWLSLAWLSKKVGVHTRHFLCAVALYVLVLAAACQKEHPDRFISHITMRALLSSAGHMANRCRWWHRKGSGATCGDPFGPTPYSLLPSQQLERFCEFFFGALRSFFTSRILAVRDHVWAVMVTLSVGVCVCGWPTTCAHMVTQLTKIKFFLIK